jgi:superfamily I DNA/RNA helicase
MVYANFYNNYPHHFGTIQSFVDKYLAIPAYKKHFQQSPNILDDDTWLKYLEKQSDYVRLAKNNYITTNSINISKLVFNLNNFKISKKLNDTNVFVGENSDTYKNIYAFKKRMLEQGQVSYAEAYSLAFSYLRKNPQLANLFSKRFSLVLIDEMQDMETHQYKLINDLFGNGNTIVQKIGDINQSIFSLNSEQEKSDWDTSANSLSLNSTTRLSHHLAEIVKPICLSPQSMEGNWNPFPLIKPTIIVFNDNTKGNVKEKFVELIHAHNLLQFWSEDKPFKVIGGRRGEVQDKHLNINSYWSDFNKNISVKTREEFDNLFAYLEKCQALKSEKNVKEIRKTLLNAICKALKLAEIRNPLTSYYFTPATFTQYLFSEKEVENKNLNAKLAKWILGFQHTPELRTEIEDYLKTLLTIFQKQSTTKLENFLADTAASIEPQQEPRQSYEYQGVKVFFDTVHGVKGETHTATLYLETYLKQVFDIGGKILPHITNPVKPDKACKKRLPQAYVAMSRATHFLCLAVHKDRFKDDVKAYFENSDNGWEVDCSLV